MGERRPLLSQISAPALAADMFRQVGDVPTLLLWEDYVTASEEGRLMEEVRARKGGGGPLQGGGGEDGRSGDCG